MDESYLFYFSKITQKSKEKFQF